jgi:EAL domain-containing protein (putative c-di-GMP-specific phosphodiesterase class I)
MTIEPAPPPPITAPAVALDPQAVLLYITAPMVMVKLRAVLDLHQVNASEPMPNTVLLGKNTDLLAAVVSQWRDSLDPREVDKVRGVLLASAEPTAADLANCILHLETLDTLMMQLQGRWLPRLIGSDSLFTVVQPLVSMSERRTVAYECLIRARDAGRTIEAHKLINAARVMGLVHQLDKAAWRSAIRNGRNLVKQGHQLFINFTPSSISELKFCLQDAIATCREYDIPFERLVFEVTEAEQIRDIAQLERIISEYRTEGAKVALDDLGSGYSSILHLADLLPDYVKLDQGLVRGAHNDYVRSVLLKGITDAAHELGILVVAEGVETEEDLKFCIAIDADLVQGFFLAKPAEEPQAVAPQAIQTLSEWVRDLKESA